MIRCDRHARGGRPVMSLWGHLFGQGGPWRSCQQKNGEVQFTWQLWRV
jgi:hypothetical protein